jgi:hypothetical protein
MILVATEKLHVKCGYDFSSHQWSNIANVEQLSLAVKNTFFERKYKKYY